MSQFLQTLIRLVTPPLGRSGVPIWGLLFLPLASFGCDICGCGAGSSFVGLLPQAGRGFVGVRYRTKSYQSHLNSLRLGTRETYQNAELWGRFYPARRVQVLAFLPYNVNRQETADGPLTRQGFGDATVLAHYNLVNTALDTVMRRVDHTLLVGGGVKLPTGKFRYEADGSEVANPNFQLGTGSTDALLNVIYTMRYRAWGWNTDFTYRLTTKNPNGYRFGNRQTASSSVFFVKKWGTLTLMPNAGVTLENAARDLDGGKRNYNTGGYVSLGMAGVELYAGPISTGINLQTPLTQRLADGQIRANGRAMVHVTWLF